MNATVPNYDPRGKGCPIDRLQQVLAGLSDEHRATVYEHVALNMAERDGEGTP